MSPFPSRLQTVCREAELNDALAEVRARFTADGRLLSGARTHLAVIAPPRGGVTSLLADLETLAAADPRLFPVRVVCEDPARWEQDLGQGIDRLRQAAGSEGNADDSPFDVLLEASEALRRRTGQVTLLLLDLGRAVRRLGELPLAQGAADPLLEFLRVLVNLMEDREPPLAVVAGWGDDFRATLRGWRRHDVDQRFHPVIPLWPGFGRERPEEAWACYRAVLEHQRYSVSGDYPGFARSSVPVGEVLDRLRAEPNQQEVDGRALLEVLLQRRPNLDPAIRGVDADVLVALCLEDRLLTEGPLRTNAEELLEGWVEPAEGGLRATEALYRELGLLPVRAMVGVREQVLFRLQQGGDADLAAEVLAGVQAHLGGTAQEPPVVQGTLARGRFHLTEPRPRGSRGVEVDALAYLGTALDETLAQEVFAAVQAIEPIPGGRASRLVLVLHRGIGTALRHRVGALASQHGLQVPQVGSGLEHDPQRPVTLALVQVQDEQAVEAVARARGGQGTPEHLPRLTEELQGHFQQVEGVLPPLTAAAFRPPVLTFLQQQSHQTLTARALHERLREAQPEEPPTQAEVTRTLRALETLGAVRAAGRGRYLWTFRQDRFLNEVLQGLPCSGAALFARLAGCHLVDRETWQEVLPLLRQAYRDYLNEHGTTLHRQDERAAQVRRLASWGQQVGQRVTELELRGELTRAAEFRLSLAALERSLNNPESDLHKAGEDLNRLQEAVETAHAEAEEALNEARQEVGRLLAELDRQELEAEYRVRRDELRQQADAAQGRGEVDAARRGLEELLEAVRQGRRQRQENEETTKKLREHVASLATTQEAVGRELAALHGSPRQAELTQRLERSRGIRDIIAQTLAAPAAGTPAEQGKRLQQLWQELTKARQLLPRRGELDALRRPVPPPAPSVKQVSSPPAEPIPARSQTTTTKSAPVRSVSTPPSTTTSVPVPPREVPSSQIADQPVDGTRVPARTPTQELPPPPAVTLPAVTPPAQDGTSPPSPPAPPGSQVVRQAKVFTATPEDLARLAELLNSSARILEVQINESTHS